MRDKCLPIYLDPDTYARLERQADAAERMPIQEARWLIRQALAEPAVSQAPDGHQATRAGPSPARKAVVNAAVALRNALTALRYVDESYPPDVRHARLQDIWAAQDALVACVAAMEAGQEGSSDD